MQVWRRSFLGKSFTTLGELSEDSARFSAPSHTRSVRGQPAGYILIYVIQQHRFDGRLVTHHRVALGLTEEHLARAVNRSRSTIRAYEKGLIDLPVSMACRIAAALRTYPSAFFVPDHQVSEPDFNVDGDEIALAETPLGVDRNCVSGPRPTLRLQVGAAPAPAPAPR